MDADPGPPPADSSPGRAPSDCDLMDELLSGDCCWPETPNNPDLFQPSTAVSFSSSPFIPVLDLTASNNINGSDEKQETERNQLVPLKERLVRAVKFIKESQRGRDVLVQIWAPVERGGRRFLSACGQPFWVDSSSQGGLVSYRSASTTYRFSAEERTNEILGMLGRVFVGRVPEWTPDVRYFSRNEYPRVVDAQRCNVSGTVALPVFERGGRSCVGVVEVVSTTQKIDYSSELESICRALQAVYLRSSDVLADPRAKVISNNSYQAALPEIRQVLEAACGAHSLPLAQTWVPCAQQGKRGSRHSDENYDDCVSTADAACYVNDPAVLPFHEACSAHHLLRGQGVAGKAFTTNQPCFSPDVASSFKTEYPLSHHAKLFRLRAAVAIRLRTVHAGEADFVLEFFLPIDCAGGEEQKQMLDSLSVTIRRLCRSLRIVTAKELEDESCPSQFSNQRSTTNDQKDSFPRSEKRRAKPEKTVSLQVLRQHFAGSLKDAAKSIGVSPTTLKKICRQHGINRWPSRKIKKVGHSLKKLKVVIDSVQGAQGTFQFSSVYENFTKASCPSETLPANQADHHPESSNAGRFSPRASASTSLSSSSCTLSSSSSGSKLDSSQLQKRRSGVFKVKAVYGEAKVRFRLQPSWGFQELKLEAERRFDVREVDLKYLDDDSEWVLLTCDEDLRECVGVYKKSSGDTIKISVHNVARQMA